jgi:exonuclease III
MRIASWIMAYWSHRQHHDEAWAGFSTSFGQYFKAGKAPHQLDYLYADAPVAKNCRVCAVQQDRKYSDHAPLYADFGHQ